MMKIFLLFSLSSAYSHEEHATSSLLRGSTSFIDETRNRCANRKNPMNCIDCRGPNGIGTRRTHAEACNVSARNGYPVPYTCEGGQNLCCTLSNIKKTNFGNPKKYGQCQEGTSDGNDCVADGKEVSMPLYKDPYSQEQNDLSALDELCCSGAAGDLTCTSSTAIDENMKQTYAGSCSGVCGAAAGGAVV